MSMEDGKTIDQQGNEVLDPRKSMDQTLAVELATVELDRAIVTAHRFPRSIEVAVKKMRTLILYNREAMENSVYALPRGGKPILGPSIGFANAVMQCWGNCRVASRVVFTDTKQKVVIAEGAFLDLETNAQSIVSVNRRIVDKNGRLYNDDMQIVTGAAAASIARRNAINQGVSRAIWYPIFEEALQGVRGTVQTFSEYKTKAFTAMAQFGVKPEQIFMALGLKGDSDMTFEHIPAVRGMYAALRDGSLTVEEMFDPRRMTGKGFETVTNPLGEGSNGAAKSTATAATETTAAAQTATHDAETGEVPWEEPEEVDPTAGMGETASEDAPTAAEDKAPVAQNEKPVSQGTPAENAPASPTKAAKAPTTQEPKPAAKKAAPKDDTDKAPANKTEGLRTPEEYIAYWEGFLSQATSDAAIGNQWSADRALRTQCSVVQETFSEAMKMKNDRQAAIKAKAK